MQCSNNSTEKRLLQIS